MQPLARQLYRFLSACGGNWRNAIFVSCPELESTPSFLMVADRDGHPVIMETKTFYQLTGEQIDPTECCGQLTEAGFESLYAQYLLWHCPATGDHPLRQICEENVNT